MYHYHPLVDEVTEQESDFSIALSETSTHTTNHSFVPGTNFQFAWDSTSISLLKTCPRKYYFTMVLGYNLPTRPDTLLFGIYFHTLIETWHKLQSNLDKHTALKRCVRLAGLLGENLSGLRTERTKECLIRSCIWYIDRFYDDSAQTALRPDGTPAVELSFQLPLFDIDNQTIYLCGHLDRVVLFQGETFITDYKTTKSGLDQRFADSFKPSVQMGNYITAGHILASQPTTVFPSKPAGIIIDGIQLGVNYNRYSRFILRYTEREIEKNLTDLEHTLKIEAKGYADANYWPARETSCDHYGGCPFKSVCSSTPTSWEDKLNTHYAKSTWDPTKPR